MSVPSAGSVGYIDSRRAWFMWGLGVLAYTVAVMQRTSFGVASVEASARYDAGASLVSLFVVVQLLVYAAMQVPVGVLADRFGTRLVLAAGAALMSSASSTWPSAPALSRRSSRASWSAPAMR